MKACAAQMRPRAAAAGPAARPPPRRREAQPRREELEAVGQAPGPACDTRSQQWSALITWW